VNYLSINRTQLLALATVFFIVFAVVHHIWANWGLVTVHAKEQPLSRVIASIERQGHAKIETDISGDTPVTMDVVKVPLADALEVLGTVTEARWRLLYFVAGDKSVLKTGESSWFGGQRPDGWKMLSFPMGGNMIMLADDDPPVLDPRGDTWTPKTAAPAPVQSFFQEAAQATNASFAFPTDWNPTVKATLAAGTVEQVVPKLVSAAGGHEDQMFFLSKGGRGGPRRGGGNDGPTMGGDIRPDFDLMAARAQGAINRLPPAQRSEAQSNFDTEQAFRKSLANMTDEERRAAFQQHMQDPMVQQMMQNRQDSREGLMNHQQKVQRFQNIVNRKLAATGKL
jgi:hypothetical protein